MKQDKRDAALVLAIRALTLYADPKSYHAMFFAADRPAGWFAGDFGPCKQYGRRVPGKEARRVLARIQNLLTPNDQAHRSAPGGTVGNTEDTQ